MRFARKLNFPCTLKPPLFAPGVEARGLFWGGWVGTTRKARLSTEFGVFVNWLTDEPIVSQLSQMRFKDEPFV